MRWYRAAGSPRCRLPDACVVAALRADQQSGRGGAAGTDRFARLPRRTGLADSAHEYGKGKTLTTASDARRASSSMPTLPKAICGRSLPTSRSRELARRPNAFCCKAGRRKATPRAIRWRRRSMRKRSSATRPVRRSRCTRFRSCRTPRLPMRTIASSRTTKSTR